MKQMKKIISFFLALAMVLSLAVSGGLVLTASAAETTSPGMEFDITGMKNAVVQTQPGQYEITVAVPGLKNVDEYNEVIIMVDASTSQSNNFNSLKELIIGLGEKVLSEDRTMKLTLMGFGVGPRYAGSFYSVVQLENFLATATQDDLLQERSATNCEVGFEFVDAYINSSPNLKNAVVIYTSDGAANLAETPMDWSKWADPNVFDYFRSFTKKDVTDYIIGTELEHIFAGNSPLSATYRTFMAESAQVETARLVYGAGSDELREALDVLSTAMNGNADEYVTNVLESIFENSGMLLTTPASASDVEKAFQQYFRTYVGVSDDAYGSYMDLFYILLGDNGPQMTDRYTRAAQASLNLQNNNKVLGVYHVGYSGASNTWMNPENSDVNYTDKLTYIYNTDFASVVGDMIGIATQVVTMEYRDVTITDPMSKWVTLDEDSIRIYDGDSVIWDKNGWKISNPPTAETPITITTNADGHRQITWKIKDGPLLHTDRYSMHYIVDVDETVEGFEYGKLYPANDKTEFHYTDHNGDPNSEEIEVPNVQEIKREELDPEATGIEIFKQEADTGNAISEIKFEIYKVEPVDGQILSAVPTTEEIAQFKTVENLVKTLTTDATGYACAELEEGIYMVVELEHEKIKEPVAPFYIELPMQDTVGNEDGTISYVEKNIVQIHPKNDLVDKPDVPGPEIPEEPKPEQTGTFTILKHDAADETKVLAGAEFQILRPAAEGENGTEYTYNGQTVNLVPVQINGENVIITTNDQGIATSPELPLGLYFLLETKAPEGYRFSEEVIPVYASAEGSVENIKVPNNTVPTLPETGGVGTTLFYTIGGLMMLAAVVLLVTKKRMSAAN